MDHPVGYLVDGAVAAGHQDQVRAAPDAPESDFAPRAGTLGWKRIDPVAGLAKDENGSVDARNPPPVQASRGRVVDEERASVNVDMCSTLRVPQL